MKVPCKIFLTCKIYWITEFTWMDQGWCIDAIDALMQEESEQNSKIQRIINLGYLATVGEEVKLSSPKDSERAALRTPSYLKKLISPWKYVLHPLGNRCLFQVGQGIQQPATSRRLLMLLSFSKVSNTICKLANGIIGNWEYYHWQWCQWCDLHLL